MSSRNKGIALSYVYTILNTAIGLFMSAFILRMLGKTEYGVYQTMTSFATYLTLFQFGTGSIMARNISLCRKSQADDDSFKRNVSTIWTVALLQAAVIGAVSLIFYFLIGTIYQRSLTPEQISYGKVLFLLVAVRLVTSFLTQVMNGIILGCEHYSRATLVNLVHLLVRTLLVVLVLCFRPYALYLVLIDIALAVVIVAYTYYYCRVRLHATFSPKYFEKAIFLNVLPLAFALFLQTIITMANGSVDKFVIGVLMSPEAVAVYSVGMFIYTTFSSLTTIPISMYMPKIAKEMREGKREAALTETLIQPCRLIFIIGGAIFFGFMAIGRPFISIVYGDDYMEAWWIATIVMGPMLINMSNGVLVNVLDIMNKRMSRSLFLMLTTVVNIGLTVWWIQTWGMVGAAVATAISTLIGQDLLMNIYYDKIIKIRVLYLFRQTFRGVLPCLAASAAASFLLSFWIPNIYVKFVVGAVVFCGVMLAGMLTFGANENEKKLFLSKISQFRKSPTPKKEKES